MKNLSLVLLLLIIGFFASTARAQCLCSFAMMSLVDESGVPLSENEVTAREITPGRTSDRVSVAAQQDKRLVVTFHIGWGRGDEVLLIRRKDEEMRIHFRFEGEFGKLKSTITFKKGDFLAERYEECDDAAPNDIKLRKIEVKKE